MTEFAEFHPIRVRVAELFMHVIGDSTEETHENLDEAIRVLSGMRDLFSGGHGRVRQGNVPLPADQD
jgi:chloramphenicol 3-O-phosphotransferase